ncbi:MAG: WecB/TagA/CpsF family glycosyltransferase [Clostridia bacterium]|nr:WecB/TagA/CpsF family glycosyltransferase [Clostridia bacterium]
MKQVEKNGVLVDGIRFFGGGEKECKSEICARLARGEQLAVYTPNPVMLENARSSAALRAALLRADMNLPDGRGVVLAARMLGEHLGGRLSGADMAGRVLTLAAARGYRVYLLGGRDGVARQAAARLVARVFGLCICGTRHGYFGEAQESEVLADIRRTRADIVFVCLGSPRQELFIDKNRHALPNVRLFMALGGTLDVWAGRVHRAPRAVQKMGLEWLWRMALEPGRFRNLPKMAAFSYRMFKKSCQYAQSGQLKFSVLKKF